MPHRPRALAWIALFTIYVVWGSTYLAIRVVVEEMPPLLAAAARFLAAGVVMGLLALHRDRAHGWPSRRQWLDYAFVGVLLLSVGNALVMWAEKEIPSGVAALIVATVPLWMALLEGMRRSGRRGTRRTWLGVGLGLLGVACVARPEGDLGARALLPALGLSLASLAWSFGSLHAQTLPRRLPLFSASAVQMLAGAVVLLLQSLLLGESTAAFFEASARAWIGLFYLATFGSLVGFTAFAYCLNELPSSTVGTYAYVNPVVAVVLGTLVLGEPLSPGVVLGGCLIVAAVLVTTLGATRAAPAEPEAA